MLASSARVGLGRRGPYVTASAGLRLALGIASDDYICTERVSRAVGGVGLGTLVRPFSLGTGSGRGDSKEGDDSSVLHFAPRSGCSCLRS